MGAQPSRPLSNRALSEKIIRINNDNLAKRFAGNGWMANTIGNALDTTIALEPLIFQGTLDKFPDGQAAPRHHA